MTVSSASATVPPAVDALIRALPKPELHVHLEGSMPPVLLLELARKHGVSGVPQSLEEIQAWYEFRDFDHFVTVYLAAVETLRDEEDFALLTERIALALAAQNVRYAEVIVSPHIHLVRGVPAEAIFGGIEAGRQSAEKQTGIQLRWLADFPGHWGIESGEATLDAVLAAGLDSIIGLNVGGIEVERDQFAELFARARTVGLHSVPHAGESEGPDRVWSAIRALGAERIGHGIRAMDDPDLVTHLQRTQLPLDVCPTSNLRTRAVNSLDQHPLPLMINAGLMVTLNSDDPPMFSTTLLDEYRVAFRMGLAPATLVQLARNGVSASFADPGLKARLLTEIDQTERTHADPNRHQAR